MKKSTPCPRTRLATIATALVVAVTSLFSSAQGETLAGWDFTSLTGGTDNFGPSPLAATTTNSAVTVGGLTRGGGIGSTGGSGGAKAWGGNGFSIGTTSLTTSITDGDYATFTITPSTMPVAITQIEAYNVRRSASGPTTGQWQYLVGGNPATDTFTNIGSPVTWGTVTSGAGNPQSAIPLTSYTNIQSVPVGTTVTFRLCMYGATGASGTWYLNSGGTNPTLNITGTLNPGGVDIIAPTITNSTPSNGATNVPKDQYSSSTPFTLTFSENVQVGSGTIALKTAAGTTIESFPVDDDSKVIIIDNLVYLNPSATMNLSYGTQYYFQIPSGAFKDYAPTPNSFAGVNGTSGLSFTTATAATAPTVVINKYMNGTPDTVELLVVGDQVPGHTVNLQGMILKDFSGSMASDNGGNFTFSTDTLWSAVPVGTLITLSNSTTTSDIVASDYTLNVGLMDTTYFTAAGGFDISTTEMVMIKAAGSGTAGTTGAIHALAGGVAGTLYTNYTGAKLIAGSGGSGVIALNSTSTISDFMSGSDAQGAVALTASSFGVPNTGTNALFIKTLRGQPLADGDGSAYVLNATSSSPFLGKSFFDKGQTSQSAKVVLTATISSVTLTKAKITIPASLGTPGSVSLSGTGSASISGQDINITGAAITTSSPLEVTINGLTTPTPSLATDNGNYSLTVQTTNNSGTLTNIGISPAARVVIPISSIRDVDTAGIALDIGTVVAIEGVCTEENFGTTNFQGFIQDSTGGVNVFSSNSALATLVRGNKYAVYGTVQQFNGLTELTPSSASDIMDLGAVGEVTPEVVTITTLLASPEAYEGKLVTVKSLSKASTETDIWSLGATITCVDSASNSLNIFLSTGATATDEPSYPVDITGIFSQNDSSSPYTTGYSLIPRDMNDLVSSAVTANFSSWASDNGIAGAAVDGDADSDGIANIIEYALGLSPTTGDSSPGTFSGNTLSFTKGTAALANGDLTYVIETSTDLSTWTPVVTQAPGDTSTTISYTLPTGQSKIFARLKVTN